MMGESGFKNLSIIGMGLMGGSLGKAVLKYCPEITVTGIVRREEMLDSVLEAKSAHKSTMDLKNGLKDADLVILSMPVEAICKFGCEIREYLKSGTVVSDMGSTKTKIVKSLTDTIGDNGVFIGSHPMAGSEKTGLDNSSYDLFQNSTCILTPLESTDKGLVDKLSVFWGKIGCRSMVMTPEEHDTQIAAVSHVPHIAAAGIVTVANELNKQTKTVFDLIGTGFKDMTRIAAGSPDIWLDICSSNKDCISEQLKKLQDKIEDFRKAIVEEDTQAVIKFLSEAKEVRESIV